MKVLKTTDVETCFDGTVIRELYLSEPVDKALIDFLGKAGSLQYFPDFPRPFFKLRVRGCYDLKGIEGNDHIRIHFKNENSTTLQQFISMLEKFSA